jgi:general secretion pathway protein N
MKRGLSIGLTLLALLVHDATASATAVSDKALDADLNDNARPSGLPDISAVPAEPATPVRVVAAPAAPARTPSANPLWGVPLNQLSGTRDRPIFSPSRRPPPAAAAAEAAPIKPPPRKKEIEPPQLSLVGTIASGDEGFGIFLDQSTKVPLWLRVGEDYQGWKLRAIQGREVTMEKDERAAVLTLPQPGGAQSSGGVRLLPVSAIGTPAAAQR